MTVRLVRPIALASPRVIEFGSVTYEVARVKVSHRRCPGPRPTRLKRATRATVRPVR